MLKTLDKGLQVLELFLETEQKNLSLAEVAGKLDLNKTVAFRILQTLKARSFLIQEKDKRFRLGTKLFLFQEVINNLWDIKELAHEEMVNLSNSTRESVFLNILSDDLHSICIHKIEGPQAIKVSFALGTEIPLHAGASGQVLLAFLPPETQDKYFEREMVSFTPATLVAKEDVIKRCKSIKSNGHAISIGEVDMGIMAMAAPLTGKNGKVVAGLTLACPQARVDKDRKKELLSKLLSSADKINSL